jgi:hypothetical protein
MQDDARAAEIASGMELPANKGAYWRFLKQCDTARLISWVAGEKIKGTPPEDLALAAAEIVADIVGHISQNMASSYMDDMANHIMTVAMNGSELHGIEGVVEFLDRVKKSRKRTVLHRTGLRLVKD